MGHGTPTARKSDHCPQSLSGHHLWVAEDGRLSVDGLANVPAVEDLYCLACGAHRQVFNRPAGRNGKD